MFKAGESKVKIGLYNDYCVERGIFNYSKKEQIDVLANLTHGRKGLTQFFYRQHWRRYFKLFKNTGGNF